jgi:predicted nucleotidyltransferase
MISPKLKLTENQYQALEELKKQVTDLTEVTDFYLFDSYVRGEAGNESDLDVLIITGEHLVREEKHLITDIAFEINLKYETSISTTVVFQDSWEESEYSVIPLHHEIEREGVQI